MSTTEIIDIEAPAVKRRRGRPVQSFEQHYTVNEVCDLLRISRSTFYEWLKQGVFSHIVKTPGGTRIPASVLNRFADSRKIITGTQDQNS